MLLTEKGMEVRVVLDGARDQAEEKLVKGISQEEQEMLRQCLRKVLENLEEE